MSNNRFSRMSEYLASPASRFTVKKQKRISKAHSAPCPQVSEAPVTSDEFSLDVLQFFFEERLTQKQLNDRLRQVAADALWRATKGSEAMDLVPHPPASQPLPLWAVSEAVQIAFRRAQNRCMYEPVRLTVRAALRGDYEFAKKGVFEQSRYTRPFNTNNRTTSEAGIRLIAEFEQFRANLYNDPAGHCTIGYGTLVHRDNCNGSEPEEFKNGISEERARELKRKALNEVESVLNRVVTVELNQEQFDALASFAYNIGTGAFQKSTLLRKLNGNDFAAVPSELKKWIKARGNVLPGLVKRREAEANLFTKGIYPTSQSAFQGNQFTRTSAYNYENPGTLARQTSDYARALNPAALIGLAEGIQIGLGAAQVVGAGYTGGSLTNFPLSYDRVSRTLTNEAAAQFPHAWDSRKKYERDLLFIGIPAGSGGLSPEESTSMLDKAQLVIKWEGNDFGEIGTTIISFDKNRSTAWDSNRNGPASTAQISIIKIDRPHSFEGDPRISPITFSYEGTYDPAFNGKFVFEGEFSINAFGTIKFKEPFVKSISGVDFLLTAPAEEYVKIGGDFYGRVPELPQEQLDYLKTRL